MIVVLKDRIFHAPISVALAFVSVRVDITVEKCCELSFRYAERGECDKRRKCLLKHIFHASSADIVSKPVLTPHLAAYTLH